LLTTIAGTANNPLKVGTAHSPILDMDENQKAKLKFIEAYFDDLERKIAFLEELFRDNHKEEALLLCCCYIEGLGNYLYWHEEGCWKNFVRILIEHGNNRIFCHIHPLQLQRAFANTNNPRSINKIGEKLDSLLNESVQKLFSEEEILELVRPVLDEDELEKLRERVWKGTFAAIAYEHIRNPLVHELGAVEVSFSETTFMGEPVPNLDFPLLYTPLQRIHTTMKGLSLRSRRWFGHDFKS
jgi:hypothetical protein